MRKSGLPYGWQVTHTYSVRPHLDKPPKNTPQGTDPGVSITNRDLTRIGRGEESNRGRT